MGKIFYLFGEITTHTSAWFHEELATIDEIIVNSNGGDVFAAISIAESLKKSPRDIVVRIQGLCASAATLLLFADKKIVASENSLLMFHAPRIMLNADYTAAELETLKISLDKLTENLERIYAKKFKEPLSLDKELWLTAAEALELGLVDEIDGEVDVRADAKNGVLYINKLCFKMNSLPPEAISMDKEKIIAEARAEELERVRALLKLKTTDLSSAIVDVAIEQGATSAQIQPYLAALEKVYNEESLTRKRISDASEKIIAVIKDNMTSGAQNVKGSSPPADESARRIKMVADMANRR